jgi:hypothetical protein
MNKFVLLSGILFFAFLNLSGVVYTQTLVARELSPLSGVTSGVPVIARFGLRDCRISHNFVERIINNPVDYKTSGQITSSALIKSSANVIYDAGRVVLFRAFTPKQGPYFTHLLKVILKFKGCFLKYSAFIQIF